MKQIIIAAWLGCTWAGFANGAAAQAPLELTTRDLIRVLRMPLEMRDYQGPGMSLKEALGQFHQHIASTGVLGKDTGLPILIDQKAFGEAQPDAPDLCEAQVRFPPYPKSMTLATALQIALSQTRQDATFLIRRGFVVIVPATHAVTAATLKQKVLASFDKTPLDEALHELAEQTGVSIQLDSRIKDKQASLVSAVFRHDTSLRDALIVLADMANLQVVELRTGVYVTTPANAGLLKKANPL